MARLSEFDFVSDDSGLTLRDEIISEPHCVRAEVGQLGREPVQRVAVGLAVRAGRDARRRSAAWIARAAQQGAAYLNCPRVGDRQRRCGYH